MLPTGHIAAGFITGYAILKVFRPDIDPSQTTRLLTLSTFFGFAPDIDVFYYFLKNKTLLVSGRELLKENHRQYWSHAPLLWMAAGLAVYFLAGTGFGRMTGLLIWLGSWSHFVLDSIEHGIMWFWPFSNRVYALSSREGKNIVEERRFFRHSLAFMKIYATRPSFYLELIIIFFALYIYLNNN